MKFAMDFKSGGIRHQEYVGYCDLARFRASQTLLAWAPQISRDHNRGRRCHGDRQKNLDGGEDKVMYICGNNMSAHIMCHPECK